MGMTLSDAKHTLGLLMFAAGVGVHTAVACVSYTISVPTSPPITALIVPIIPCVHTDIKVCGRAQLPHGCNGMFSSAPLA